MNFRLNDPVNAGSPKLIKRQRKPRSLDEQVSGSEKRFTQRIHEWSEMVTIMNLTGKVKLKLSVFLVPVPNEGKDSVANNRHMVVIG